MKIFGIILMICGAFILLYFGIIGIETNIKGIRITNIAALQIGSTLFIAGSIFTAAGAAIEFLEQRIFQNDDRNIEYNEEKRIKNHNIEKSKITYDMVEDAISEIEKLGHIVMVVGHEHYVISMSNDTTKPKHFMSSIELIKEKDRITKELIE